MGQVVTRAELKSLASQWANSGKIVVSTNGCFDILHTGHVRILKQARAHGDLLVVGLNSDESVRRLKGAERPINCQEDRAEILASLECVDYVTIFTEDTPVEFLKVLKPKTHIKGGDYSPEDLAEKPVIESWGGKLLLIDLVPDKSTTRLVDKIRLTRASNS